MLEWLSVHLKVVLKTIYLLLMEVYCFVKSLDSFSTELDFTVNPLQLQVKVTGALDIAFKSDPVIMDKLILK